MAIVLTLVAGGILALAATATFRLFRESLLEEIERDVERRAVAFARSAPDAPYNLDVFTAPDIFLQVLDPSGQPIAGSGNLGERVLPLTEAVRQGSAVEARVGDRPLFLTAAKLPDGNFIVVARSPMTIYSALGQLRTLLVLVVAAGLVLAGGVSWFVARVSLRPLARVIKAAERVRRSRDLSQRVAHRGPPDEIGRLAETFNAMLAELDDAYRSLDHSNQRLRQFLADCSHELRAPLTLILSNLDVLAKVGNADPSFRDQALSDIRAEADRMAHMVTQLLILARADAGAKVDRQPVRLAEVVADACRDGARLANGIDFVPPDPQSLEGAVVTGSADYLRQTLLILLENAFKYTPATGEVRVEATVDGDAVRIAVINTGSGIDSEDLPRIFDRFYRGRNADGVTGTGLGLSIAKWVSEQHGGRIDAVSSTDQGTRFMLVLPLAPEEALV
jgi:two-component system OmpR family sensor kinase